LSLADERFEEMLVAFGPGAGGIALNGIFDGAEAEGPEIVQLDLIAAGFGALL
jgi:hypothetical protein